MKTLNGYITEDLDELPLDDLEATIIDLYQDNLNEHDWKELMDSYMLARWKKLQDTYEYTTENIRRLDEINELIKTSAERVARKAWRMYQTESAWLYTEEKGEGDGKPFNDVLVETHLFLPYLNDKDKDGLPLVEGVENETLWSAIADYYRDDAWRGAMPLGRLDYRNQDCKSEDEFVDNVLWGMSSREKSPEELSWSLECAMDREATKGTCFVWPFKRIVSDWSIPFSDLLKIKGYKEAVTVEYSKIHHEND